MNVFVRLALRCVVPALLLLASSAALAQTDAPLLNAGVGFAGDYANRASLYPYSAELSDEEDHGYLDRLLRERLAAHPQAAARLSSALGDARLDQDAVAFALVQESVEQQRMEGKVWIILTLQANVLAFNKRSNSIVASYPVRLRLTRVSPTVPSPAELKDWVRSAYAGRDPHANIFDQWLDRLATLKIRTGATRYLRVKDVSFTPEAEATLASAQVDPKAMRNQLANAFEAAVAEAAQVPIVPNSVGQAIGQKIACRFADGAEIALVPPQEDYALSFTVRGFASKTIDKPAYAQDVFRVLGAVSLVQPDLGQVVLNENVYETQIVTRPRDAGMQLDAWPQYYKTLQLLMAGVAKEMTRSDDGWLGANASRGLDAKAGFVKTNQVMMDLK